MRANLIAGSNFSVDGTDCQIQEPLLFNAKWYSHKFKGPGLRYEVGVCISTGHTFLFGLMAPSLAVHIRISGFFV